MHRLKKISPILAVLVFLVLTGTVLASLSPPSVSQNGNSFRVSMTPLDGSVRNWIYYHKAARVGDSNSVDVCVPGGGWVQFRAVSVLTEDNKNWEESSYTKWYEVPNGSCGTQNPPPAPTPTATPTPTPTPTSSSNDLCEVVSDGVINAETYDKYRKVFPNAGDPRKYLDGYYYSPSYQAVIYILDSYYQHSDGRYGSIQGWEYYNGCTFLKSHVVFVPSSWSGGDVIILLKQKYH